MPKHTKKNAVTFVIALLTSTAPVLYFFYKYAINLPYLDDFWAVYDFTWLAKQGYENERKLIPEYLFSSNLEHIIAYTKASSLILYYLLREKFSLIYLMLIGNLSWLTSIGIMGFIFYKQTKASWLWLAFFPLIGISLQFNENYFWGMASHQNFSVTLFAILALYCLAFIQNSRLNVILGLSFAIIGYLTSSTGVIIFYVGTVIFVLQKRYYWAGIYLAFSAVCSIILFQMSVAIDGSTIDIDEILNTISFVGSIAHFANSNVLSIIFGMVLCFFFTYYVFQSGVIMGKQLSKAELFFLRLILFVLIVGIIAGLKRPNVLLSRYKHYSAIATLASVCLVYIKFYQTEKLKKLIFLPLALALAFVYNLLSTAVYSYDVRKHYEYLIADTYNWYVNDKLTVQFQAFCDNDYYKNMLKDLKINVPTNDRIDFLIKNLKNIPKSAESTAIDTSFRTEKTVAGCAMKMLNVSAALPDSISSANDYYLVLSAENKDFVFSLFPERNSLFKTIKRQSVYSKNLTQTVHLQYLPAGNYEMSLVRFENQTAVRYGNEKKVLVENRIE